MDYAASRREQLERNGFGMSKTFGRSMRPLIWGGQHCVAVAPLRGEPRIGDLLMFSQTLPDGTRRNIVHRLVGKRQSGERTVYITRGDNCIGSEAVAPGDIIGRVAEVHRTSGFRPWHAIPAKRFAVTDRSYRLYSRIWSATWPARRLYYLLRAHIGGLRSRIKRLFSK